MRARLPVLPSAVLAATLIVTGCSSSEVVDFGATPSEDAARLPADDGVDVADAPAPEEIPPPDARLVDGGWPEAAAVVAREAAAGRPTLINLFASWCAPCRAEMPMLLEASADHPDVAFLGIDHMDRREDGQAFVDEFGIDFPTLYDVDGDVAYAVGGRGMPTTVIFDADGRLAGRVVGELTPASLERLLDEGR